MMLLLIDVAAVPGKRDELVGHIHELLGGGADGLLQYAVGVSDDAPDAIAVVQEWDDDATHAAFLETETYASYRSTTESLVAGAAASRSFTIDVPRAPEAPIISLL